jgi:D-beta-D-heptose 7-phosphate kinase/D-beta-D-heptose 1-phosphate adenosyltransferase
MKRLTPARLDVLLDRIRGVRVLVVGDAMLDVYLRGGASRISPEAPVPVVKVEEEWRALGGAANVATNVVALGAACSIVACVGADRAGEALRAELARAGIADSGLVTVRGRPTTVKTRLLVRNQQVARYDQELEEDVSADVAAALASAVDALAAEVDVIVLEDYNKGVLVPQVVRRGLEAGGRHGRPVVVDPKERGFFDYMGATVFKPNLLELSAALREPVLADDDAWMERTRARLGCDHLLLTLGEHGIALKTQDGEYLRVPTVARSVYDVSGAGDTVTAAVAVALAAGATAPEAAVLANHAAGIEVGKAGVATVSPDELRTVVRTQHATSQEAPAAAGARETPQGRSGWRS